MAEPVTRNDDPQVKSRGRRVPAWLRRTGIAAAAVLLVLCLGAIAGWVFRTTLAEWAIAAYIKTDDVTQVSLTVDAVESDHILIRNLRISGKTPISIARIRLDYHIDEFLAGRIDKLAVIDVRSIQDEIPIEIDQIIGNGTFAAGFDGLTSLVAGLDVIRIRIGTQQFEPGRVDIYYRDTVLSLDASLAGPPGHATLIAKGTLDPGPDPFHWFLSGRLDAGATTAMLGDRFESTGKASFSIFGDVDNPLFFTEDSFAENPSLPDSLSMDGEINVALDTLVVDGQAWPVDGHQRLIFGMAKLSSQTVETAAAFDATLTLDKRQKPDFGFDETTLHAAGTVDLSEERLTILLADGPVLRIRKPRLGSAARIPGDLTLTLSGEGNRVDAALPAWTVSHHLNGHILWQGSDIALQSAGSFSDPGDPVVFTLRGAFDATPFLAGWRPAKTATGKGNVFVAGRVSQPFPQRAEPAKADAPWPGDIRLDGAFGLETNGIRLPGSTGQEPVTDKIEIALKGFNGSSAHQQGRLSLNAALGKRTVDAITLGETKLNIQGRVVHGAQGYQFLPTFDSALSLQELRMANGSALPNGLTLQLSGDDNQVSLSENLEDFRYKLTFAHLEADGDFVDQDSKHHPMRLTIPSLASQSTDAGGHRIDARDATIDLPAAQLTIHDVDATANGKDRTMTFTVQAGDIRHHATPPLTTPLSATAKGRVEGDSVQADIDARQRFGPLKLRAVVTHDVAARAGRVDFTVPKFRLDPKSHSLAEAFPPASKWFTDAEGGASLNGHLLWDRDVLS
ncbi:MAG: hypothetical protein MJE12_13815, partial [Alphaproteobacteria bacterium]|nr:hypothetical protein [Alphaproteobacteria bacterium]